MFRIFFIIFVILLTSACYPRQVGIEPGLTGVIIDANTSQPVAQARIETARTEKTLTDELGRFSIAPVYETGLATPMGGMVAITRQFIVVKTGYQTLNCACTALSTDPVCRDMTLQLRQIGSKAPPQPQADDDAGYGEPQCFTNPVFRMKNAD